MSLPPLLLLPLLLAAAAAGPRVAVRVQALQQGGLRIGVVDVPGADLAIINANINLPIDVNQTGSVSRTAVQEKHGLWAVHESGLELKAGDVVFYWVYLSVEGEGSRHTGREVIAELEDPACEFTASTVNGKGACAGQVIFEDSFDTFNSSKWSHTIQLSGDPDFEFCTYVNNPENSFVRDGILHIKPTALDLEQLSTPISLDGCTWEQGGNRKDWCELRPIGWNIAPPTHSAWLRTKGAFSFKYGRVLFRARPAAGDWIMSRLLLWPQRPKYGAGIFESGWMMMGVRGNSELRNADGGQSGAVNLVVSSGVGSCGRVLLFPSDRNLPPGKLYTDSMRDYVITWTPREMRYEVDGQAFHTAAVPVGGYLTYDYYSSCTGSPWKKGTLTAPFDEEFYLNLLLMVGGRHNYPDRGTSAGGETKPWKDTDPRGKLWFIRQKDKWFPTWTSDFEIDFVQVTALGS